MSQLVVLDNTVLCNFALVGRSDLPGLLWAGTAGTTAASFEEYQAGIDAGALPPESNVDGSPAGDEERFVPGSHVSEEAGIDHGYVEGKGIPSFERTAPLRRHSG